MKNLLTLPFALVCAISFGQNVEKYIQEKNVERVIRTLTTDDMMGRSAMEPAQIEKAAAFLEKEFKSIGLQPLNGLTGFRQEFEKQYINDQQLTVLVDGEPVRTEDLLVVSDKKELSIEAGLSIKSISLSADVANKDQYFFKRAFSVMRDTASSIILVDREFEGNMAELKNIFKKQFLDNRKSDKIFILGKKEINSYSIKVSQKIGSMKFTNIVGMLKGHTTPDEMVVFAGHYDHLGVITPIEGDSIANGADDDASGTTAVVELARYFKRVGKNNRTLIFSAFTAEEIGGYGSIHFSKQLNPDKVVAMFNIEMIGKLSKWGVNTAFITGFEKSNLGQIIQKNLAGSAYQLHPDPYPEQDLFYRSDNKTLAVLGVPAHTVSTDQIPIDALYHSVNDEFESLDIKNMTNIIRLIAIGSQSVVDGKDTPTRIDKLTLR